MQNLKDQQASLSTSHTNWTAENLFEKRHTFSPISYFIVIVVFFDNIWTRSSTPPERHMRNQKNKNWKKKKEKERGVKSKGDIYTRDKRFGFNCFNVLSNNFFRD